MADMDKRVSSLEERAGEVDKEIAVIRVSLEASEKIQDSFKSVLDKLGDALRGIEISLTKMNSEMESRNENQKEMKKKIGSLEKWLRKVDGRGNFNIVVFLADKIVPALITGGVIFWILKLTEVIP